MRSVLGYLLALAAACAAGNRLTGHASTDGPEAGQRLVVATFDEHGVPEGMGEVVADMLTRCVNSPRYELLERRQVRRVLEEQAFSSSDLTQPREAVRYGKLAETRFVLVGAVYRIEGTYIVSARMVDSASGVVHESARAFVQFRTVDEMSSRVAQLASELGLRTPPEQDGTDTQLVDSPLSEAVASTPVGPTSPPSSPLSARTTVRDLLEEVGSPAASQVKLDALVTARTVRVGQDVAFTIRSEREGFLSLFVVDASGQVGMLLPNSRCSSLKLKPGQSVSIPADVPFRLRAQPPLGPTRVKAVLSTGPIAPRDGADIENAMSQLALADQVDVYGAEVPATAMEWTSAEIEFIVVDDSGRVESATPTEVVDPEPESVLTTPNLPKPATAPLAKDAADLLASALHRTQSPASDLHSRELSVLRWPLRSPFVPACDVRWSPSDAKSGETPCIAVIDADFDPDDPFLQKSFSGLSVTERERLRAEIRRNGPPSFSHGNRVASIIASDAPWLPSAIPGAPIVPIRITTIADAPSYRADRGGVRELLDALRASMSAGCRVVNLSLSVPLARSELASFSSDPVWDELERKEVVVVCAAGNGREDLDATPRYPACLERPNILCVGAVGPDGRIATWGDQGSAHGRRSVDVFAPGSHIAVSDGGGRGGIASGTSYACAFASAAVARLIADEPEIRASDAVNRIIAGAAAVPELDGLSRAGLLRWPASQR